MGSTRYELLPKPPFAHSFVFVIIKIEDGGRQTALEHRVRVLY